VNGIREVDCTICYDKGVIHFTDLAPSNKHEPTPGLRPEPTCTMADWNRQPTHVHMCAWLR
jgi:hypothetical protein